MIQIFMSRDLQTTQQILLLL